ALALSPEYKPPAVTLDIFLPDIEGWRVLERLKSDLATRHLPVCVISTEEARRRALASGAIAFLPKPIQSRDLLDATLDHLTDFISRPKRNVVVVEPDARRRQKIVDLVASDNVVVATPASSEAVLALLTEEPIDCVVVN